MCVCRIKDTLFARRMAVITATNLYDALSVSNYTCKMETAKCGFSIPAPRRNLTCGLYYKAQYAFQGAKRTVSREGNKALPRLQTLWTQYPYPQRLMMPCKDRVCQIIRLTITCLATISLTMDLAIIKTSFVHLLWTTLWAVCSFRPSQVVHYFVAFGCLAFSVFSSFISIANILPFVPNLNLLDFHIEPRCFGVWSAKTRIPRALAL